MGNARNRNRNATTTAPANDQEPTQEPNGNRPEPTPEPKPPVLDMDGYVVMAGDTDRPLWTDEQAARIATGATYRKDMGLRAGIHAAWRHGIDPTKGGSSDDALDYLHEQYNDDKSKLPTLVYAYGWLAEQPHNDRQTEFFHKWYNRNKPGRGTRSSQDTSKSRLQVNALKEYTDGLVAALRAANPELKIPDPPDLTKVWDK